MTISALGVAFTTIKPDKNTLFLLSKQETQLSVIKTGNSTSVDQHYISTHDITTLHLNSCQPTLHLNSCQPTVQIHKKKDIICYRNRKLNKCSNNKTQPR